MSRAFVKEPDGDDSKPLNVGVPDSSASYRNASENYKFAAAVAEFGMLLRDSRYKGQASYDGAAELEELAADVEQFLLHEPLVRELLAEDAFLELLEVFLGAVGGVEVAVDQLVEHDVHEETGPDTRRPGGGGFRHRPGQ